MCYDFCREDYLVHSQDRYLRYSFNNGVSREMIITKERTIQNDTLDVVVRQSIEFVDLDFDFVVHSFSTLPYKSCINFLLSCARSLKQGIATADGRENRMSLTGHLHVMSSATSDCWFLEDTFTPRRHHLPHHHHHPSQQPWPSFFLHDQVVHHQTAK